MKNPDTLPSDAWYEAVEARITKIERILDQELGELTEAEKEVLEP